MRSVEYKRSFDKSFRTLNLECRQKTQETIQELLTALESSKIPQGLDLKRLQGDQWEARVDIHLRLCFRMKKDLVEFALVGTHDDIKNFLKNY